MLKLLIEDDSGQQTLVPLIKSEISVGRQEGNEIRLTERNISRFHAKLFVTPDGVYIENVAARYGTKLNSKKISGLTKIDFGDHVRIGDYHFYVQDDTRPMPHDTAPAGPVALLPEERPKFVVISSNFIGAEFPVPMSEVTIGRDRTCQIQIEHRSVSSIHASLKRTKRGSFVIEDLGSSNGTKVNGMPCKSFELNSGDIVELGHIRLRFCAPGELWYLFESFDPTPQQSGGRSLMVVVIVGVLLIISALTALLLYTTGSGGNGKNSDLRGDDSEMNLDEAEFNKYLNLCQNAVNEKDFETAKQHCDKAYEISKNEKTLTALRDKIAYENAAEDNYNKILTALDDKDCEKAIRLIESITPDTLAYESILKNDLKSASERCRENKFGAEGKACLEQGDIACVQRTIDTLQRLYPASKHLATLTQGLNEKTSAPKTPETEPAGNVRVHQQKASGSPEDAEKVFAEALETKSEAKYLKAIKLQPNNVRYRCAYATFLKLESMNQNSMQVKCKMYKQYKKIRSLGGGKCQAAASQFVKDYAGVCE